MRRSQVRSSHIRAGITRRRFGALSDGRTVELYVLANSNGMQVAISTFGACVTSLNVPDRHGQLDDVVLGFADLDAYLAQRLYFGSIVGRYCGRISQGRFALDGQTFTLSRNNGANHLHGGYTGFDGALWRAYTDPASEGPHLKLCLTSADGEDGYPGQLDIVVTYSVTESNELRIDYRATTTKPTPVNLTSHCYFNLSGMSGGNALDHQLSINASRYLPLDDALIPTGEIREVAGTPFDFRTATPVGARIDVTDEQLGFGHGYDHSFVLDRQGAGLFPAAELADPSSGRVMSVLTSEPGVHLYSGNFLDGSLIGKAGSALGPRSGLCLETQHFADSPNRPEFPSTILRPGGFFHSTTVYRFSVA